MRQLLVAFAILSYFISPVQAKAYTAPPVPEEAREVMPQQTDSFARGLWELAKAVTERLRPEISRAGKSCLSVLCICLILALLQPLLGMEKRTADLCGAFGISTVLLQPASSMIHLAAQTITRLTDYSKLLLPVMTGALAAQGGVTRSAALYAGTAVLNAAAAAVNASFVVPLVYLYLTISIANGVIGDDSLKRLRDLLRTCAGWILKTTISLFTGYMGLTGIIQGSTDAAALKAAKVTLSGAVPVVGGALSNAADTVLASAGLIKNAAGVYGMLAIFAIGLEPFLSIAIPYLLLRLTAGISAVFATPRASGLISEFASALGLLLAITGTISLLMLISTVCFMKGVG